MTAEVGARRMIRRRISALCGQGRGIFDRRTVAEGLLRLARVQRGAAHVRQRDDARSMDPFPWTTTATATVAQSWARRLIFVYDQPADPSFGTRISTSISSGARAVWKTPVKNSRAGMERSPPGPRATSSRVEGENHGREVRRRDRRVRSTRRSSRGVAPAGRRPDPLSWKRSRSAPGARTRLRRPCAA